MGYDHAKLRAFFGLTAVLFALAIMPMPAMAKSPPPPNHGDVPSIPLPPGAPTSKPTGVPVPVKIEITSPHQGSVPSASGSIIGNVGAAATSEYTCAWFTAEADGSLLISKTYLCYDGYYVVDDEPIQHSVDGKKVTISFTNWGVTHTNTWESYNRRIGKTDGGHNDTEKTDKAIANVKHCFTVSGVGVGTTTCEDMDDVWVKKRIFGTDHAEAWTNY